MKNVTIDRKTWLRGGRNGLGVITDSFLCNTENHMCCLGFALNQIESIAPEAMTGNGSPYEVLKMDSDFTTITYVAEIDDDGLYDGSREISTDNLLTDDAIRINDNGGISDTEREQKLITIFAKSDIQLTFIN